MDLSEITVATPGQTELPTGPSALDKDAFMQLLTSQLKNQDPLEPVSNEDFIAQLATFSNLEEMENLNENIVNMVLLQQSNALLQQLTDSSALIGMNVTYFDAETGETKTGVVDSVKVEDGLAQLSIGGVNVPLVDLVEVNGEQAPLDDAADDTTDSEDDTSEQEG